MKNDDTSHQHESISTSCDMEKYRTNEKYELVSKCLGTESSDSGQFSDEDTKSCKAKEEESQDNVTDDLVDSHRTSKENRQENNNKDSESESLCNSEGETTEPYTNSSEDDTEAGNSTNIEMSQSQDTDDTCYMSESSMLEDDDVISVISQLVYEESTDLSDGEVKILNLRHQNNKSTSNENSCVRKKTTNMCTKNAPYMSHIESASSSERSIIKRNKVSYGVSSRETLHKNDSNNTECLDNIVPKTKIHVHNENANIHTLLKDRVVQDKRFECDVCGKCYSSKARHREHILSHNDDLPFKCYKCFKGFLFLSDFKRHQQQRICRRRSLEDVNLKSDNQRIKCYICGMKFKSAHTKTAHMKRNHSNLDIDKKSTAGDKASGKPSLQSNFVSDKMDPSLTRNTTITDFLHTQTTQEQKEQQCILETDRYERQACFQSDKTEISTNSTKNITTTTDLSNGMTENINEERNPPGTQDCKNKTDFDVDETVNTAKEDLMVKPLTCKSPTRQASFGCDICGIKFLSKVLLIDHIDRHKNENDCIEKEIASDESYSETSQSKVDNFKITKTMSNDAMKNRFKANKNIETGLYPQENKRNRLGPSYNNDTLSDDTNDVARIKRPKIATPDKNAEGNSYGTQEETQKSKDTLKDGTGSPVIKLASDGNTSQKHKDLENSFKCEYCEKRFKDGKDLRIHTRVHTGERPFKCSICNKSFTQISNYYRHKRTHARKEAEEKGLNQYMKGDYKCDICRKVFGQPQQLSRHMAHHTGDKFRCDICGKEYIDQYCLTRHLISHSDKKPFKCSHCDKSFNRKECLKLHERKHTGIPSSALCNSEGITLHTCKICTKTFVSRYSLNLHMHTHTGEKPFVCDLCGKRFSQKSQLNDHYLIHTGNTPFTCEICKESFNHRNLLRRHMISHTNVFPQVCKVCGKGFYTKHEMEVHVARHSGKEDHCCHLCSKKFVHQYLLDRHVKSAHQKQKCEHCGIVFKSYNALRHHRSVLHRQKI